MNLNLATIPSKFWQTLFDSIDAKKRLSNIAKFIEEEQRKGKTVYPEEAIIFQAFKLCSLESLKIVILGQDPYHNPGQAHGLSFSVPKGVKKPPSLVNIFKEIESDLGIKAPDHGNLENWASQGVLLLNAILSVNENEPASHHQAGWENFTDGIIEQISNKKEHVVFMLWGNYAQQKVKLIDESKHLVLTAVHPSPLSAYRGFFGCKHFSKANSFLEEHGMKGIEY